MALKAALYLGSVFFRSLRQIPTLLYRVPKTFQLPRVPFNPPVTSHGSRLSAFFRSFGRTDSLVRSVQRTLSGSATQRPGALWRAYRALAGSVQLRNQFYLSGYSHTGTNEFSDTNRGPFRGFFSWFNRFPTLPSMAHQSSHLLPKELIGCGCNSAVWAADVTEVDGTNHELAVKVLYNYYASSPADLLTSARPEQTNCDAQCTVDWVLLHRQLERELALRPTSGHPNIVPVVGQFLDRAPGPGVARSETTTTTTATADVEIDQNVVKRRVIDSATSETPSPGWVGAEQFPEGFGGQPLTYYLLMPRFDATLDDLLTGRWRPASDAAAGGLHSVSADDTAFDSTHSQPDSTSVCGTPVPSKPHPLETDDAVAIIAQMFDAIGELELHGVAHRDIKGNNVLLRCRSASSSINTSAGTLKWIDEREVRMSNARFHVAITDFGCAVRTSHPSLSGEVPSRLAEIFSHLLDNSHTNEESRILPGHSGNMALLAPEIACALDTTQRDTCLHLTGADYYKADMWAAATLVYPLFGLNNPFTDATLNPVTYLESELPQLPDHVPGVISWLISQCLRHSPTSRPRADLVADVLHTWCLLRHIHRRCKYAQVDQTSADGSNENSKHLPSEANLVGLDIMEKWLADPTGQSVTSVTGDLRTLLDVCWAADWLTGPARPPEGLRVLFYRRITLGRLAHCLQIVYDAETSRAKRLANRIAQNLTATPILSVA